MASQAYPAFDETIIQQSLEAAKIYAEEHGLTAATHHSLNDGALTLGAHCISVTVQNGKACLNLPFGIGSVCLPIPSWVPNGKAVQACLDICTKWGIPCGVEVTVSLAGQKIIQKGFGCSC